MHIEVVPDQHHDPAGQLPVRGDQQVPVLDPGERLGLALAAAVGMQPVDQPAAVAGLACYRPGDRSRLIYRLHCYRGREGETRAFTWTEYRDLLIAAHRQLPGGVVVLVWDNLNVHRRAELRAFTDAQAWLRVFRLPAYAPDLNPVEGIWSVLKGGVLANLAVASCGHLVQVIRHGLTKIQYRPGLIEGCLAGTGLTLEPGETPVDIVN
jgi:hypothetical protein